MSKQSKEERAKEKDIWGLTVTIPIEWKNKIDKLMLDRGYRTYTEYVRDLIRKDLGDQ